VGVVLAYGGRGWGEDVRSAYLSTGALCAVGRVFRILKRVGGVGHGVLGIEGNIIEGSSGRGGGFACVSVCCGVRGCDVVNGLA
jgi:hypothetical protein